MSPRLNKKLKIKNYISPGNKNFESPIQTTILNIERWRVKPGWKATEEPGRRGGGGRRNRKKPLGEIDLWTIADKLGLGNREEANLSSWKEREGGREGQEH